MISQYKFSLLFLLYIASQTMFPNGMGLYLISSTIGSSDPVFREIKDVTLLSEKLYFKINNSGSVDVTVKYVLSNNSQNDYLGLDYAFPVDYLSGINEGWDRVSSSLTLI